MAERERATSLRAAVATACAVGVGIACLSGALHQGHRRAELMGFPDPGGTRRAWGQKQALAATSGYRSATMSDRALTQPLKRAGPLDAERQAEHDMYYRAIRRPNWQSKQGQVR
jgi:hypothetical protein